MKFGNIDEGIKVFDKPITAIKGIVDGLKSYNSVLSESTDLQKSHIDVVTQQNSSLGNYLSGLNGAEASLGGYAKSLVKSKIASIGLQAASIALNAKLDNLSSCKINQEHFYRHSWLCCSSIL